MATYVTLTIDAQDIIGADFDRSRCSVWLETNTDHGLVVVDTSTVRLGGRRESPDADGVVTFANLVATNSATNPASFGYRVKIIYTPKGSRKQGHDELVTAEFPLTTSKNLADIDEAWDNITLPVSWRSDFRDEMEAIRDGLTAISGPVDSTVEALVKNTGGVGPLTNAALQGTYETQTRVRETGVNVKAFGAVGDWNGSTGTNNLTALQAARAALPTGGGRLYLPEGDYRIGNNWNLTGDNVEVIADPNATIRTTAATTDGHAVAFIGAGTGTNTTPKAGSFRWQGGRIIAGGSGTADNAIGAVRVKQFHVSDVVVEADRKAITTQYGIDSIVIERFRVDRAGVNAIAIETDSVLVSIRDGRITDAGDHAIYLMSVDTDPTHRIRDVVFDNVRVDASEKRAFYIERTDRVTMRKCHNATAPRNGSFTAAYFNDATGISVAGDCTFTSIGYGISYGFAVAASAACTVNTGSTPAWAASGAPDHGPVVRRSADGMVTINGAVGGGPSTAGAVILTVPPGYRPQVRERILLHSGNAGTGVTGYVDPDGTVRSTVAMTAGTAIIAPIGSWPAYS